MKNTIRLSGILFLSFSAFLMSSTLAIAEEPVISGTTDKTDYTGTETITETVELNNASDRDIDSITITGEIPEGYSAKIVSENGTANDDEWTVKDAAAAGEKASAVVELTPAEKEEEPVTPSEDDKPAPDKDKSGKAPDTSDHSNASAWTAILISALLVAAAALIMKYRQAKRALSLLLAGTLAAGISPFTQAKAEEEELDLSEYTLQWEENFDGTELNRNDWNVELHNPGWVNAELQAYIDSEDVLYLEDGHLVIKPVKDGDNYYSGRVNTMNKHDFKYGIVEARAKVPTGMGYLPAFWMMPTNESLYGQWPRCGEIDIMEVMGQQTDLAYGTIHFGNPHSQKQGTRTASAPDYAADYHTYAVEWLPGSIAWYIDGVKFYETNDWYSTTEGKGTVTYPAPFDQPFYVILNLAIGGSWVGYPDETTTYEDQEFDIDYVRVYQKDSYDENVLPPEKEPVEIREPDETGNYLINSGFDGLEPWVFATAMGGVGNAEVSEGEITITTENAGNETYGIQLLQRDVPLQKGATYVASFDAYADEERSGLIAIEGGEDSGWVRYLNDTSFKATPEKQHYEYVFTMEGEDDTTSVFEFNLGNTSPACPIHISNVRLEKQAVTEEIEIPVTVDGEEIVLHASVKYVYAPDAGGEDGKSVLSDGNYIYNGEFQEGSDRKEFWEVEGDADVSVTPLEDGRRLKVVVNDPAVVILQEDVPTVSGSTYALSFDIEGDAGVNVQITGGGQQWNTTLAGGVQTEKYTFTTPEGEYDKDFRFVFNEPGTYYIDNVRLVEDALIKNGSFNAGLTSFEAYFYNPDNASCIVDSQLEDNAFDITINDTGDADWHIQLKQEGVPLDEGQCYKLTLDMKSSLDRKILVALQRDGNKRNDDWTPYLQQALDVSAEWQTYELYFKMNPGTEPKSDPISVFSISMGAVNGVRITDQHRIFIDNISLEKIDESEMPADDIPEIQPGENIIDNGDFEKGTEGWEGFGDAISPAVGTLAVEEGKAVIRVENVGSDDWNVQLKHFGLIIEKGSTYKLTFRGSSTVARDISLNVMSKTYDWYGGSGINLEEETKEYSFTFTMNQDTNTDAGLFISMGKTSNAQPSTIILDDFVLEKLS